MAIPKLKSHKVEWSTQSMIQLGVSGLLILLSLLMGWFAIARFQLKRYLVTGLQAMDRNQEGNVVPSLQAAVSWKSSHGGARLALAKKLAESTGYDDAEQLYKGLLEDPDFTEKPLAYVGLGVVALKRADRAKDAKEFAAQVKAAQDWYKQGAGIPEAKIGARLADLMVAVRDKNADGVAKLQGPFTAIFNEIKKSPGSITKEGLIDLYAGAGLSYAYGGSYSKEAAQYFNSCYSMAPQWPLPLINKVYLDAAQFRIGDDMSAKALQEDKAKWDSQKNEWDMLATGKAYEGLRDAWFQFSLAHAYRFGATGLIDNGFLNYVHNLKSKPETRNFPETWKLAMGVMMRHALRAGLDPEARNNDIGRAGIEIDAFLKDDISKRPEAGIVALRATALSNWAVCLEQRGARDMYPPAYQDAVKALKDALEIEKKSLGMPDGSYETIRNLAVILKRLNDKEADAFYNTALKLAASPRAKEDAEKLKLFWAGTLKE